MDQNQPPADGQQPAPTAQPRPQYAQQPLPNMAPPAASIPKEYFDEVVKLRQELSARDAEIAKRDKLTEETKASVAKLTEQVALTENQKKELDAARRADSIRNALKMAALEHQAVDPDDVVSLISGQFTVAEDGRVISKDATPVEAGAFVKGYLEKKPHLAKPRVATGSGASPFTSPAPAQQPPPQFDMRTREGATAALHHALGKFIKPASTG